MKLSPHYDGPAVLSIDGSCDDHGVALRRQGGRLQSLLADLSDDEWRSATRCDGWTVQDVVAHLVTANTFWASSVSSGLAGSPSRVLAAFDPAAHPPMLIDPMRSLTPHEVLGQLAESSDAFFGALADLDENGWSTRAESPVGHVPVRLVADHALWDSWVHERDIAIPLGRATAEEPDEIGATLRYAASVGPALTIGTANAFSGELAVHATDPEIRFVIEVGDSILVRDGVADEQSPCLRGTAVELIEALSIRAPLPADAPDEWHELVVCLATMFDTDLEPTR